MQKKSSFTFFLNEKSFLKLLMVKITSVHFYSVYSKKKKHFWRIYEVKIMIKYVCEGKYFTYIADTKQGVLQSIQLRKNC